jgi:hypothetical protein
MLATRGCMKRLKITRRPPELFRLTVQFSIGGKREESGRASELWREGEETWIWWWWL